MFPWLLGVLLLACGGPDTDTRPELLVYCGVTMVQPVREIARQLEQELDMRITILQGGSQSLYDSLRLARVGDIYFAGSESERTRHLDEGLLGRAVVVGYNRAALLVAKGNPKGLDADLARLKAPDVRVIIGSPETGSIGRETQRILEAAGLYSAVLYKAVERGTDSRHLNIALREGWADVTINWRTTGFFDENRAAIDVIDLPPDVARPNKLMLNELTFTRFPDVVDRFFELAISPEGQRIFERYGFLGRDAL
jgi:molybdate transport system substrate-binding protein